jgi:hypothetical protein
LKKLKVHWAEGQTERSATVEVEEVGTRGQDTLVFRDAEDEIVLLIPAGRLLSAVPVDEENGPPVDPDDLTLWNVTLDLRQGHRGITSAEQVAHALAAWGDKKGLA